MRHTAMMQSRDVKDKLPLSTWEFVALMAALMSLNALAIDSMLPALGRIQESYQLQRANDQQLVLYVYVIGLGAPQLIFGPLSDSLGRRAILIPCLLAYTALSFACMIATSFSVLLLLRFLQGMAASGVRVVVVSVVRDLVAGRAMARIMSLIFTVFMIVPLIAPAIGQGIMIFASWQWTFGFLGICGIIISGWAFFRLPETHPKDRRQALNLSQAFWAYREVVKVRETLGYVAAGGVIFATLFAFISSSEQIFSDVFNQGHRFALLFAIIAGCITIGNLVNASLVERYGMRRISHIVLIFFISASVLNLSVTILFGTRLEIFLPLFSITIGCFGMMGSNFNAIAMEPQGKNTASASAAYGFASTLIASILGWMVSSSYNETLEPILLGYMCLGALTLVIILITEKGRLFGRKS